MQHNLYSRLATSAARSKRVILGGLLILALFILILEWRYGMAENKPENPCPQCTYADLPFQIGNGPIIDEYMEDDRTKDCSRPILKTDETALSIQKSCSSDSLNFFLLWSTAREDFRLKHFRVIDSIFKYHPKATLHMITSHMSIDDFKFYVENNYKVVHHKLDPEQIFKDTPLDRWAARISEWKTSSNYFSHVTDAMRLALLWKYGGVYLDTDAVVLRNVQHVRNAVGVQHPSNVGKGEINGAVLMFDRQHPFLYFAMHFLVSTYDPKSWDIAGPQVVTKCAAAWSALHPFMVRWIPQHKAGQLRLPNEPLGTASVTVFADQYAFYALGWWINPRLDVTPDHPDLQQFRNDVEERGYAYHYVNQMVRGKIDIQKGIYLYDILQRACLFQCSYQTLEVSITDLFKE